MGQCRSTPIKIHSQPPETHIAELLHIMDAYHCRSMKLDEYITMAKQDVQYSPNMTVRDQINIYAIEKFINANPSLGDQTIESYLLKLDNSLVMAMQAEENMLHVLLSNPKLRSWFVSYKPNRYMFDPHPNLLKLSKLVDSDGHSGASFALCCHSVRRKYSNRLIL